uniref:Rho-GAP domain-containing protein n=1 Tax=Globodera rostochiensis TaxID=31243 RepID=A0A914HC19_GLORO
MSRKSLADFAADGAVSTRPRRSLSATRSLTDSTVHFVGRIGASLRIAPSSARRRQHKAADEELSSLDSAQLDCPKTPTLKSSLADHWFRTVRLRRRLRFGSEQQQQQQQQQQQHGEEESEETEMVALFPSHTFLEVDRAQTVAGGDQPGHNHLDESSDHPPADRSQNCPRAAVQRRYMKEGPCQLTSILSLSHHHRYLFLFNDLLLVCKQKGENSYKLKEKVALEFLWLSANNCTHSFLIGWPPTRNHIAHFSSEREKSDWFDKLNTLLQQNLSPRSTTVGVFVQIEGRHQFIRKEVRNGRKADELLEELRHELKLPVLDPHLGHYELCFCPGQSHKIARALPSSSSHQPQSTVLNASDSLSGFSSDNHQQQQHIPSPGLLRRVHSHSSIAPQLNNTLRPFHGVENVYAVLMDFVRNQLGLSLSDSQLAHLDTCPLVNCRLVLRQNGSNNPSHSHHKGAASAAAMSLVNQFRRVLGRADSSTSSSNGVAPPGRNGSGRNKRLFGRQLRGTMPPQPVLTMIDHLLLYGSETEGIFRKSPKQQTVRILRQQLDQGQVPDFHQFNVHVTASLLKEYLRCIPGELLISGNYRLWMEATADGLRHEERIRQCRKLLELLPPAHTVLLRSVLRLLRRVAANESHTKMGINALAVCVAPSLLEKLDAVESVRLVPELVMFLVEQAPALLDGFLEDGPLLFHHHQHHQQLASSSSSAGPSPSPLHQSTDSGLSEVGANGNTTMTAHAMGSKRRVHGGAGGGILRRRIGSVSPDSGKLSSSSDDPASDDDDDDGTGEDERQQSTPYGPSSNRSKKGTRWLQTNSLDVEELEGLGTAPLAMDGEEDDSEKTPVALSRENSDVKDGAKPAPNFVRQPPQYLTKNDQQKQQQNAVAEPFNCAENVAESQRMDFGTVREGIFGSEFISKLFSSHSPFDFSESPTGRKMSAASVESAGSTSSGGTATLSRRALIATTKNETLGLNGTGVARGERNPLISRQNLVNSSTAAAAVARGIARRHGRLIEKQQAEPNNNSPHMVAKAQIQRVHPISAAAIASKNVLRRPPWTPQPEKRCVTGAKAFDTKKSINNNNNTSDGMAMATAAMATTASNSARSTALPSPSLAQRKNSSFSASSLPPPNWTSAANGMMRRCSAGTGIVAANGGPPGGHGDFEGKFGRRRVSAETTAKNCPNAAQKMPPPPPPSQQSPQPKYMPPKRTAEELLLDKLEVNWSVPQIRKTFQRNTEVKPIDTVYAKLPATAAAAVGGQKQ